MVRVAVVLFFALLLSLGAIEESNVSQAVDANNTSQAETDGFDGEDDFADEFAEEFDDEFADEFAAEDMEEDFDPLSGYNRAMTTFNDAFYTHLLFPVARGYRYVVHEEIRLSIGNFFDNLFYPVRFVNNLLQLKFTNAAEETGRFVLNSTIGIFGLFDPAEAWFGLEEHDEDFGQTLGYWGVGAGPHIVIPILGPSNLRDTLSMAVDWEVDPLVYQGERNYNIVTRDEEGWAVKSFDYLNDGSFNIEEYESLKRDAVDLYPFFKNIYEQMRKSKIEE